MTNLVAELSLGRIAENERTSRQNEMGVGKLKSLKGSSGGDFTYKSKIGPEAATVRNDFKYNPEVK